MANIYNVLPSQILGITDEYTAYCLNEACAVIRYRLENGEEPVLEVRQSKHYTLPSEVYAMYEE